MKEDLRSRLQGISGPVEGGNRVREYLQARILASLQRSGAMVPLAFQGGTALRFLYSIRRYSEDLDFTNLTLLNNALRQTGWVHAPLTDTDWRKPVLERLRGIDWPRIVADVKPFLEVPTEVDLLTEEIVAGALMNQS
jgi:hypothetical protein